MTAADAEPFSVQTGQQRLDIGVLGLLVQAAKYQQQGLTECTLHLGPQHFDSTRRAAVAAVVTREIQANGFPVIGSSTGDLLGNMEIRLRLPAVSGSHSQRIVATEAAIRQYEVDERRNSRSRGVLAVVAFLSLLALCLICGAVWGS
ncbi:hypothetical protein [Micromonospora sp. NPDC005305]|uniref:hypothetical protein n=1 Tax=Micromonospora sp. NPDC005305 TaxID=3156875 RepID=UPI0033B519E5